MDVVGGDDVVNGTFLGLFLPRFRLGSIVEVLGVPGCKFPLWFVLGVAEGLRTIRGTTTSACRPIFKKYADWQSGRAIPCKTYYLILRFLISVWPTFNCKLLAN